MAGSRITILGWRGGIVILRRESEKFCHRNVHGVADSFYGVHLKLPAAPDGHAEGGAVHAGSDRKLGHGDAALFGKLCYTRNSVEHFYTPLIVLGADPEAAAVITKRAKQRLPAPSPGFCLR